jgi:hypothetical protein
MSRNIRRQVPAQQAKDATPSYYGGPSYFVIGVFFALAGGVAGAYVAGKSSEKVADSTALASTNVEKIKVEGDLRLEESKAVRDDFDI